MNFIVAEVSKFVIFWLLSYGLGSWVFHKKIKVNYTRKIHHFSLLFIPLFFSIFYPYDRSGLLGLVASFAFIWTLFPFLFREKVPIISRCFMGIDRPEDRPYTLLWLSTQFLASIIVIIPVIIVSEVYFNIRWDKIGLFVLCLAMIGDGFAEPIGVRFGKIKYKTFALFTKKRYYRTIEGSLTVFISSIIVIAIFSFLFTSNQLFIAFFILPITITLIEAFSPHTWDSPFLLGGAGIGTIGILYYF